MNPFEWKREQVMLSPKEADEIKTTTCYMCACRCGIRVYLKDGGVRYIEGNPDHPVNKGVLCAKGSAGIMNHNSPARLTKPLLRVGERGAGEFKEIEWDEALSLAQDWLGEVRRTDPKKLAFFTGRDQSQSLTGWWAAQFGTPNFAAHGGFCSVNMAAAGLYTLGGAFWEFGEPDWDHTKYFMMWGVAEDHDSNPIKMGLGKLKTRGDAKFVAVNPVRSGYGAIADEWIGIRPGTDGLFALSLVHELLRSENVDLDFLSRYTNAPWLVIENPGGADDGLIARDADGNPLCWDGEKNQAVNALSAEAKPVLAGRRTLEDGRICVPSFDLLARRYLDPQYAPDAVAERTGVSAETIKRIAAELAHTAFSEEVVIEQPWTDWAGRKHERMIGRPISMHGMRGISAHSNGFHTCRSIHLLQVLLGSIDCPGGWRYKAPFPRPIPPGPKPAGKEWSPNTPLGGMPLGNPTGPEDLLVDEDGTPKRIDKAYSWEHPLSAHGLMHMVIHNAWKKDPYGVDVLFMYMANMAWNSSMNVPGTLHYLTDKDKNTGEYKIPKIIYSDAYYSEMVPYADLILPDTTYLERWDCISLLDRPISSAHGPGDAIRQPVVKPDRDVRPFQDVLIDLGARLGLPGFVDLEGDAKYPGGYSDYIVNHERLPGIGPLAGWRGEDGEAHGRGAVNKDQLDRYIENGCFWSEEIPLEHQYFKHANLGYLDYAAGMGWIPKAEQIVLQLYSEPLQKFRLAAQGHGALQPPEEHRERVETYFDPLPIWYMPFEEAVIDTDSYPMHALTQRPMQMYHSWGSQNAWLRQITARNRLFINEETAAAMGVEDEDWVWVISHAGRVKGQVKLMSGVNADTVWTWNAIGKRKGAWRLSVDAPESTRGFLLNHIISELLPAQGDGLRYSNSDPVTGQAAWFDLRVRVEKCLPEEAGLTEPTFDAQPPPPGSSAPVDELTYGTQFKKEGRDAGLPMTEWIGNRREASKNISGIADGHGNKTGHGPKGGHK
ncbi:formate dehydrogenase [Hwanghaeella grinnelliae]|uniref:Formate dehydrogenase n=1 Tax=Hwanghaeella grinnelliae TaxID=2500179 RepID=A0A437QTE4_9PROT|nr:molybdopterin oxidoreductase family protein [Hwanghaeella grinnelliae]RVU37793.1 formate dehydrogenase [Hwanghaeella grinnelliae]